MYDLPKKFYMNKNLNQIMVKQLHFFFVYCLLHNSFHLLIYLFFSPIKLLQKKKKCNIKLSYFLIKIDRVLFTIKKIFQNVRCPLKRIKRLKKFSIIVIIWKLPGLEIFNFKCIPIMGMISSKRKFKINRISNGCNEEVG